MSCWVLQYFLGQIIFHLKDKAKVVMFKFTTNKPVMVSHCDLTCNILIKLISGVLHPDVAVASDYGFHLSVCVPWAHQNVGQEIWHRHYVSIFCKAESVFDWWASGDCSAGYDGISGSLVNHYKNCQNKPYCAHVKVGSTGCVNNYRPNLSLQINITGSWKEKSSTIDLTIWLSFKNLWKPMTRYLTDLVVKYTEKNKRVLKCISRFR